MQGRNRILHVDVCDYTKKLVCPVYDNSQDISGQAHDVFITYERNGWKELSFSLPTKCFNIDGVEEDNFRLQYIIADYRLKVVTDKETDWYLITEEGVKHEAFSKNITVTAGHISKLLKNRSLDLEFSDKEGNNVGTADMFLNTILEGTGWKPRNVTTFYEDDGKTVKIRSMNAAVKTGAFRLIEMVCGLFEAKPVYNGDYTVDILPMNPFSDLEPGEIPEAVYPNAKDDERFLVESNVIELHYNREIKTLERKRNTDNIATRLYGYGAYGDAISRYCSIQTAKHDEYIYVMPRSHTDETEYQISDGNVKRYFTAAGINQGDKLIWSMLDYTSRRYVWNDTQRIAYKVYENYKTNIRYTLDMECESATNYFPFLSDYTYYEKVGLLTDEAFQSVAAYQRDMIRYYQESIKAQEDLNAVYEQLSDVGIPKSGFLKLDIQSCEHTSDGTKLTIRWSDKYPDGVIYRSDYNNAEKDYFRWHIAQKLKDNGDPVSTPTSIVYVLHDTEPVIEWEYGYLKDIDNRTHMDNEGKIIHDGYDYANSDGHKPKVITLWSNLDVQEGDSVYLFCVNGFTGKLGPKFSADETEMIKLEDKTTVVTEKHPTIFFDYDEDMPDIVFNTYGWCYQYNSSNYDKPGVLYFSWPERNDVGWKNVYFQNTEPTVKLGEYFFNTVNRMLYHGEVVEEESEYDKFKLYVDSLNEESDGYDDALAILETKSKERPIVNKWVKLDSNTDELLLAQQFSQVFMFCRQRDQTYKGLYEEYTYTNEQKLKVLNYAFPTPFGYYWLFTTDREVAPESTLRLDTIQGAVYQDDNVEHLLDVKAYPFDTLIWPETNNLNDVTLSEGSISLNDEKKNGNDLTTDRWYRTNYIPIWPNETYIYNLPEGSFAVLYDANRKYVGFLEDVSGSGEFSTTVTASYSETAAGNYSAFKQARYMRISFPKQDVSDFEENYYVYLKDRDTCFFANDKKYTILQPVVANTKYEPIGINSLMRRFRDLADSLYTDIIPTLQEAQENIQSANEEQAKVLGDILREGWWQDGSYVEGDEQRMYNDALDNLKKIAQPEISYTFDFLDLYGSNHQKEYSIDELSNIEWPDIQITDAAHLVDPEINVNQWGYIDKLSKCFDQPWKTKIEVNTQLTLMGQHEFKDVLTRIAEVAAETKNKQTIYSRAEAISSGGTISTEQLTGEIDTTETPVTGTGWRTDEKGNMVLESADGMAAMMFNGSGLHMANSKNNGEWNWSPIGNGFGLNADSITRGTLDGAKIKPDSITTRSIKGNVGNELDIGSNKALALFATEDGSRPSGSLRTNDALIEIKAGVGNDPAKINVKAGGEINLQAGVEGGTKAQLNIGAYGKVNINAKAGIDMKTGGTFTVQSGNFSIDTNGNLYANGKIESGEGKIGGWYIGESHLGNAETLARSSAGFYSSSNANDVILWAGAAGNNNNARNLAAFKVKADGSAEASNMAITGGQIVLKEDREVNNETVRVNNFVIDKDGLRLGRTDDLSKEEYNFTVDKDGKATATQLQITGGTVGSSTVNNSTVSSSSITDSNIRGGEIHIGVTNNDTYVENFSVSNTGYVTMKNGEIRLGSYDDGNGNVEHAFVVDNAGKATITKGSIQIYEPTEDPEDVPDLAFGVSETGYAKIYKGEININDTFRVASDGTLTAGSATLNHVSGMIGTGWAIEADSTIASRNENTHVSLVPLYGFACAKKTVDPNTNEESFSTTSVLDANGNLYAINGTIANQLVVNNQIVNPSSEEYKQNIQAIEHRDGFDLLKPVSFQYKQNPDSTHFGLIYEDVKKIYPEVCSNDGTKGISYLDFIAVLIKEVQDLRKRVSELERK